MKVSDEGPDLRCRFVSLSPDFADIHGVASVRWVTRELMRGVSLANPLWGASRIHGELPKLGIEVSQSTIAKYMARQHKPPPQTWRAFLRNHVEQLVSTDFFVVPTASFRVLFVFVVLAHQCRRVIHFSIPSHPTSEWAVQRIAEAFPLGHCSVLSAVRSRLHRCGSVSPESARDDALFLKQVVPLITLLCSTTCEHDVNV